MAKMTCPNCNCSVMSNSCTNKFCNYNGKGLTPDEHAYAIASMGTDEHTVGGTFLPESDDWTNRTIN